MHAEQDLLGRVDLLDRLLDEQRRAAPPPARADEQQPDERRALLHLQKQPKTSQTSRYQRVHVHLVS